jgi:hypothetical protein
LASKDEPGQPATVSRASRSRKSSFSLSPGVLKSRISSFTEVFSTLALTT